MTDFSGQKWHFVGLGGAGMSALASALLELGAVVSGSDVVESAAIKDLTARGVMFYLGHDATNIGDAEHLVLTAALKRDNPEWKEASRRGLEVIKRAELLGRLMETKRGVAVAGTHGKTTTSAMVAWILAKAGRLPSYMVGATIRGLGSGGHWGAGRELVAEADEYDRSFLSLHPEVAIVTNIEPDHLEYYGSIEAIFEAFANFAANVRPGGLVIACADDEGASKFAAGISSRKSPVRVQLYGKSPDALWRLGHMAPNSAGGIDFSLTRDSQAVCELSIRIPGEHNVLNAIAAFAACAELGLSTEEIAAALATFEGTGRRFEVKGEAGGVTVIDDYAHHPTEITATLAAARGRYPDRRLVVLFQPHTYTRTRDFLDDFSKALSRAGVAIVTEIYASRETDTLGVSGRSIVEGMEKTAAAEYVPDLEAGVTAALKVLRPGDVLITMGAGDVWKAAHAVFGQLAESGRGEERHIHEVMSNQTGRIQAAARAAVSFKADLAGDLGQKTGLRVLRDEPMSKHNSLRIGGPADLFVQVTSKELLVEAVKFARTRNLPFIVLGNGTNILVSDTGIKGLAIHNRSQGIERHVSEGRNVWCVDTGVLFSRLARMTCEEGWTGQEWAASVPGSVGGGVVSNAGAHGKELKDDLISVAVLTAGSEVEIWPANSLELGYRTSRFKAEGDRSLSPREIILSADIALYQGSRSECDELMRRYLEERQAKQPQGKSAGSTFKNPPGNSAGHLIEQVGLKGQRYGQAQFSPKHANFMMNLGGARAADVLYLMRLARERVHEQFGIVLEPEIEFVGEE